MINLLSSHLEDCSTPQYFCFAIRCEVCGEFWYSSSIPFSKAAYARFADGWSATPASSSAMRWICVGSAPNG